MEAVLLFLGGILEQYAASLPSFVVVILVFIGSLHLILPPVQAALSVIILATPSQKDDEIYKEVTTSKAYGIFIIVIKWLSGLDLKKEKKN